MKEFVERFEKPFFIMLSLSKHFSFFIVLLVSTKAYTQQYNFINYSIEDGLVQSQIQALCQDKDGYVWIGTLGGLSKFDGINFENYSTDDGLLKNQIDALCADSKNRIWIGTQGGVSVYNGYSFHNIKFKDELSENFVLSITEDQSGKIWLGTDGGGVIFLSDTTFTYITLPGGEDNNYVRNIFVDKKGNKWLATRKGVSLIDSKFNIKDTIRNINATQIFIEEDQSVWCSTFGDGVFHISKNQIVNYTTGNGLISDHIRAFCKRLDGSYWFVSKNGISKLYQNEFKKFTKKDGLSSNNINCAIEGNYGNLFLGADGGGLVKFTNENFVSYTQADGISSNVIMSVVEDNEENIWLSTYGSGVCLIGKNGNQSFTTKDGLGNNTVWCSVIAKDNRIWFGTSNGISVFDGKHFKTYNSKQGLNAKKVYALREDSKGNIWIGTKEGLSVLFTNNDSIYNYSEIEGISRNIRYIYNEENKAIWFCSSDGLFRYDIKKHKATKFDVSNGLPDISVMCIVKDRNKKLWIGTNKGLVIYKNNKFKKVRIPDNYASNNINFLQLDDNDNLWIGTNYGLYQLNVAETETFIETDFIRYSNLDGLKSLECNQNASFIDDEGNLWFGTSYGLMKHSLNAKSTTSTLPIVLIKGIRLFFEKNDFTKYATGIDEKTMLPKNLKLRYNKNHLTFDFVGIYHTSPDKVKYRFKLDGFDENWQPVTTSTFVTYSNIPNGDFTFQLSATTDMKVWTKPVNFSFTIRPPFWLTWWFYALSFIAISTIIWLIIKRKKKIDERKRATQLIMDKSKMLSLEQQALNASMNRHFIFNALNSIQYYINRQDKVAANRYLSSFAKLVRKNLDSSLVNEIYLDDEIERIDLYLKLEEMRFQNKFSYKINVDKHVEPQSIKIPSMLLQPFVENSIWHGILPSNKPGNIIIDVLKQEDKLIINIVDEGIGIERSLKEKKDKKQQHHSKGMELTKGRIKLISKLSHKDCTIEGPFQIYDEKNEIAGTKVSVILTL